jgi:integrase
MQTASCHTRSIAQLLGIGNDMRTQNPKPQKTTGSNPRWYIRPYVDRLQPNGSLEQVQERVYLGTCAEMTKRQALTEASRAMATLNDRKRVVQAQIRFGEFLDEYTRNFVLKPDNLAASSQGKYLSHIKNHVRPAFGDLMIAEVTTRRLDEWLSGKAKAKMSSATRMDLRNLVSGIFTQAGKWGYWSAKNPALDVTVGRHRAVREKRKLTDSQTRQLLEALPEDVRFICMVALFCTLRISEVLGLQWKHIDFERDLVMVRQRFYRGDLDEPKTRKAKRDVPLGQLADRLRTIWPGPGSEDIFVFSVKTERGISRDDRDINHYFLGKTAKAQGVYWKGFGFHAFRREAITAISASAGVGQAMNAAGHTKSDMSQEYTLVDLAQQERAIEAFQARILGPAPSQNDDSNKTEQAKLLESLHPELPEEIRILLKGLELNGGLAQTRTVDLYRVKVAL